jgi:hypothetical protein
MSHPATGATRQNARPLARMLSHKPTTSTAAAPAFWKPKNSHDQRTLRLSCSAKRVNAPAAPDHPEPYEPCRHRHRCVQHGPNRSEHPVRRRPRRLAELGVPATDGLRGGHGAKHGGTEAQQEEDSQDHQAPPAEGRGPTGVRLVADDRLGRQAGGPPGTPACTRRTGLARSRCC